MKIAICGTHCAGKSTLVDFLKKELDYPIIKEVAGNYSEEERQKLAIQLDILNDQITEEYTYPSFISDRSVIDNIAYIKFHSYKNKMPRVYEEALKFINFYLNKHPYNLIILVEEYFPLIDNGIRNLDEDQQKEIYEFLMKFAPEICKIHNIPILKVSGNTRKRIKVIKEWLTQHQQH